MPAINIQIKNMAEIRAAFSKAPQRMTKELNEAIHKSIFGIERDSKMNTPVDTGRLRSSHKTEFSNLRGSLMPTVKYALYVHQGTGSQSLDISLSKAPKAKGMRARPFLFEAIKTNEQKIDGYFTKAVQKVLDDIAREV